MNGMWIAALCLWIGSTGIGQGQSAELGARGREAERLIARFGARRLPPLLRRALRAYAAAEDAYRRGDYALAREGLDALWKEAPRGAPAWRLARSPVRELFLGRYPAYYALQMLDFCVRWRLAKKKPLRKERELVLRIVMAGKSKGLQARDLEDLRLGKGALRTHLLAKGLREDGEALFGEALWLFSEYVHAITGGELRLRWKLLPLPGFVAKVGTREKGRRNAGLLRGELGRIFAAVPEEARARTDWWWVIYPSNVPDPSLAKDFERSEWLTGGMAAGPNSASPCFLSDDLWLLRKPPHLGRGEYTALERRVYLPHWLQHEFFHYLFRRYPGFGLEKRSHQWFDRRTWPKDFVGRFEPDYYDEALKKRLLTAKPRLGVGLRHRGADAALFDFVRMGALLGYYRHEPYQNPWHGGWIERVKGKKGVYQWRNEAGRSWELFPELRKGRLLTGPGNPYLRQGQRSFLIALAQNEDGEYLRKILGFRFGAGLFRRIEKGEAGKGVKRQGAPRKRR